MLLQETPRRSQLGEGQQNENMTEEFESGRGKQWGHSEGQTNLEPITQHTLWDRTTVLHFPYSTPTVLMMSYYSGLSYITVHSSGQTARR